MGGFVTHSAQLSLKDCGDLNKKWLCTISDQFTLLRKVFILTQRIPTRLNNKYILTDLILTNAT